MSQAANTPGSANDPAPRAPLTWRALALAWLFYLGCLFVATYPSLLYLRSTLPFPADAVQQIWIMRWVKTCILAGQFPLLAPGVQYPIGAALAQSSPIPLQTALYIGFSTFIQNDILIYNIIWVIGLTLTGLGTFALAYWALGHRPGALVAGMLAMLSGPMLLHANGHLELVHVGFFPLFLLGWIRFVDAPSLKRLATAAALYVLLAASAAYFSVFAIFPAALYALLAAAAARRASTIGWLRGRAGWACAFVALVVPCLIALFAGQVLAAAQGNGLVRERSTFLLLGAPLWSYLVPTNLHIASKLLPSDLYKVTGRQRLLYEVSSYLGIITWALVVCAAVGRARMRKAGFFWAALGLLVVLSMGAYAQVGSHRIYLPGWWLWKTFPPIRMTRVPARFNLLAGVCAAVIAGAGLRVVMERFRRPQPRWLVFGAVSVLALVDLAHFGFPRYRLPAMPACYRAILARDPAATFLEVPVFMSWRSHLLNPAGAYWQLAHHAPTSLGYTSSPSLEFDHRIAFDSPFAWRFFEKAKGPQTFSRRDFGIAKDLEYLDYVWVYLHAHGFRYVVVHHDTPLLELKSFDLEPLENLLSPYRIYDDPAAAVYDRALFTPPARPTLLCDDGFHPHFRVPVPPAAFLERKCSLVLYNPDPQKPIQLWFEASAFHKPRVVKLLAGAQELARWEIPIGAFTTFATPPLQLPAGIQTLVIQSDGQDRPANRTECIMEDDHRPYSFVARNLRIVGVEPSPSTAAEPKLVR